MPARRRLPDDTTLTRLYWRDIPAAQIARAYGVTHPAVLAHWQRLGLPPRAPRYRLMPWTVAAAHTHAPAACHARALAAAATGRADNPHTLTPALRWARNLTAHGLALTYDRARGFNTRPAHPRDRRVTFDLPDNQTVTLTFALPPPTRDTPTHPQHTPQHT